MDISTQEISKEETLARIKASIKTKVEKNIRQAFNEHISYNDKPWAYYYYGKAAALKDLYAELCNDNLGANIEDLFNIFDMLVEKDGEENEQD